MDMDVYPGSRVDFKFIFAYVCRFVDLSGIFPRNIIFLKFEYYYYCPDGKRFLLIHISKIITRNAMEYMCVGTEKL